MSAIWLLQLKLVYHMHTWNNLHPATNVKDARRLHEQQTDQEKYCQQGQPYGGDHEERGQL